MEKFKEHRIKKFFNNIILIPFSECWIWNGPLNYKGYGKYWYKNGATAHKFSYILHKGEVQLGLQIDHLCNVKACVNPDHLKAVTARENSLRSNSVAAINHRKERCSCGLDFSLKEKARVCKPCQSRKRKERYYQNREAAIAYSHNYYHSHKSLVIKPKPSKTIPR